MHRKRSIRIFLSLLYPIKYDKAFIFYSPSTGSKGCSFAESHNGISLSSGNEFLPEYSVIDSADSTPSSSTRNASRKKVTRRFSLADLDGPSNWELEYVRNIISNAELALEDFAVGDASEVITRNLFDHLENEENGAEWNGEECPKLGRKVLFDCVNECLETRCKQMYVGTCSSRVGLSPRKDWLVEELHEEISGWKSMSDWMLDDLVDKDMSTRSGRWLDFGNEAFEEGVEIEKAILNSLVNELVSELMVI